MSGFRDRLVRDEEKGELRDGGIRYVMLRADALMGLFRLLPEDGRQAALAALGRSVTEHGGRSARSYRERLGGGDPRALLDVVAATAPDLGWGIWRFSDAAGGGLALEVENSPFAAGFGASGKPVCAAIAGMLETVSTLVLGTATTARETECRAVSGGRCHFLAEAL
jgi:hypothetical protein